MLKRIIIKNINSIDTFEVDLTKGNFKFGENNVIGDTINPIALYGHNGSGKSSFLKAFGHLISLMTDQVNLLVPFTVNNFLFERYVSNPSSANISFVTGSIHLFFTYCVDKEEEEYEYFISTTNTGRKQYISNEYLLRNGVPYFTRKDMSFEYKGEKHNAKGNSPLVPLLRSLATDDVNDGVIQGVNAYISSFVFVDTQMMYSNSGFVSSKILKNTSLNDLIERKSEEVMEILRDYDDFPIYKITKSQSRVPIPNINAGPRYMLELDCDGFKGKLPIEFMSSGMLSQSAILSILLSMPNNGVLFIDEIEIALHPSAIESFLKVIRNKKIQVIFSSHNTFIMQTLRPDQIYFTKWSNGSTKCFRLSKIYPNIRQINNIEKMYLSKTFDEAIDEAK